MAEAASHSRIAIFRRGGAFIRCLHFSAISTVWNYIRQNSWLEIDLVLIGNRDMILLTVRFRYIFVMPLLRKYRSANWFIITTVAVAVFTVSLKKASLRVSILRWNYLYRSIFARLSLAGPYGSVRISCPRLRKFSKLVMESSIHYGA